MSVSTPVVSPSSYIGNAAFEARNEALEVMAKRVGIRLPETRLPPGTALLDIGEEAQRSMARDYEKLPSFSDGIAGLRTVIKAQDKRDVPDVKVQTIRMLPDRAELFRGNDTTRALSYTKHGFDHVAEFIRPSGLGSFGANILAIQDPALRAQVFNHHAERAFRGDSAVDGVVVRTLKDVPSGRRFIRAVTSTKHSLETGDDLAVIDAMQANIPNGAKLRVTRGLDRTDFEIVWPAMARQLKVGDVAVVALSVRNSETKAGSILVQPKLLRVLCYNFTTAWSEDGEAEVSIRHVGDLGTKLTEAFVKGLSVVEPFVKAFADAYAVALPKPRGEVLAMLGRKFKGELGEGTLKLAADLWDADGAQSARDTLAGLVNALTRASQEQSMAGAEQTERIAGRLVTQGFAALA